MFDNLKEAFEKYVLKVNTTEDNLRPCLEITPNKIQQSQNEDRVSDITDYQGRTKNDNNCHGVQASPMAKRKKTVLQDVNCSLHATENTDQLPNSKTESLSLYKKQHQELCHFVGMLDNVIAVPVAICLFSSITNICINFYMTAKADEAHDYFNAFFILLNGVISVGVFLTCGILINNKVSWMGMA